MKTFALIIALGFACRGAAQTTNAEIVAERIAQRLKDSLSLSDGQKNQIYNINLQLSEQKLSLRTRYTNLDSLQLHTQLVEGGRDSLYSSVLTKEQFDLYRQKKSGIVRGD